MHNVGKRMLIWLFLGTEVYASGVFWRCERDGGLYQNGWLWKSDGLIR